MRTDLLGVLLDLHRRGLRRARARCVAWTAGIGLGVVALMMALDLPRPPHGYPPRWQARDDARRLVLALEQFQLERGVCPLELEALVATGMLRKLSRDP